MRTLILAAAAAVSVLPATARAQDNSITFYEYPAYLGKSVTVTGPVPTLAATSIARRAQSARVTGSWTVCTAANYQGTCSELTANTPALLAIGLARKILSFRPSEIAETESGTTATATTTPPATGAAGVKLADLDVDAGVEGQDTEFYVRPALAKNEVAAGSNERTSADIFCKSAGYGASAYSARSRTQTSNLIDISTGTRVRGYALRDVLCRR